MRRDGVDLAARSGSTRRVGQLGAEQLLQQAAERVAVEACADAFISCSPGIGSLGANRSRFVGRARRTALRAWSVESWLWIIQCCFSSFRTASINTPWEA